jgi:phosphatidylglycerol:prolipoprotein diacylglycerol transferase
MLREPKLPPAPNARATRPTTALRNRLRPILLEVPLRPELFRILDISVPAYFILLVTGFAFATATAASWARRLGENPDVIVDLALITLLLGVVGGRIFHVLFDGYFWDYVHLCTDPSLVDWQMSEAECAKTVSGCFGEAGPAQGIWDAQAGVCHPREADCFAWLKFWAGGLTYYGGLLFAAVGGLWLLKRDRFPLWKGCDLSAIGIAMGLGFGRIGCLLAGCCFGHHHDGAIGLSFPPYSPASQAQFKLGELPSAASWSHPVYPTQVFEALLAFGIAAFCMLYALPRKKSDGEVFAWFLGLYAAGRFAIEFLRADDRGAFLGLSTSQHIGIVILVGAVALYRMRRKSAVEPAAAHG